MPHDEITGTVTPNAADAIIRKVRRLIELGPLIVRAIVEWRTDEWARNVSEFADIKTQLQRELLIERSLVNLSGPAVADVRAVLKKIAAGELLPVEQALSGGPLKDALRLLTEDDFEELGREGLYSWMSHVEYAQGLYRAGALVVARGEVPKNLERFTDEARQCFAFQQYNAVCALCRTMLEITVRDVAIDYGVILRDTGKVSHLASRGRKPQGPELKDLIHQITEHSELRHLRDSLNRVRQTTNAVIHGDRSVSENEALRALKETLSAIHRLYEAHEKAQTRKKR
ncbi:MAG TPA: DUF4145 domain-containing protein [Burkholderiales bacterium]|nr:DUF4145 domain-containing protein [Burkholderiales bacterium]